MLLPLKTKIKTLDQLNLYDILWAISHPFRLAGVIKISQTARKIAEDHLVDTQLDGDLLGGQLDAFRHILWSAMLTQRYGARFAKKVAFMYEKSNKIDFYRNKLENYLLPDAANMMMNLMNNEIGFEIGLRFPKISVQSLVNIAKNAVLEGKAWIIKKDKQGNYLDYEGNIIPKSRWLGKWNTPKVIVKSNFMDQKAENSKRQKNLYGNF